MPKRQLPAAASGLPPRTARLAVEATISRLVDLLDRLDPDPDLEASLGWGDGYDGDQTDIAEYTAGAALDAEFDDSERDCDTSDDEPSLGAPINMDQSLWAQGASDDREASVADDDGPLAGGGHTRADRLMLAAVEAQLTALAARLRKRAPIPRRSDAAVIVGPDGALYSIRAVRPDRGPMK